LIRRPVTQNGQSTPTRRYFLTRRPAQRLEPIGLLPLRRRQGGIESICPQRLDVRLHEDPSRVRSVRAVTVLGGLSRSSLAWFQAAARRPQPVRDRTVLVGLGRLQQRPRPMLDRLLERGLPP
jgi:hypothetical protein